MYCPPVTNFIDALSNYPDFTSKGSAPCAQADPEAFFPERVKGTVPETQTAKKICRTCPYTVQCLEWAIEHDERGIWGGTTERDRRVMKQQRRGKLKVLR